jgi:ribosome-binding ATPase YchF (GTP1/OBG family)
MSILILGRKGSGKSSLLKILSQGKINIKPFDTNIYAVPKEDYRLFELAKIFQSKIITPIHLDFIDFPGNAIFSEKNPQLMTNFYKSSLIFYIIPEFLEDKNPLEEIKEVENFLILNDLELCERYLKDRKIDIAERTLIEKIYQLLMEERVLSSLALDTKEIKILTSLNYISLKPIFYLINVSQKTLENKCKIKNINDSLINKNFIIYSSILEEEILDFEDKDALEYLSMFDLKDRLIKRINEKIFQFFNWITFFTGNEKEVKAWKLKDGSTVLEAANTIHTDMAKGFIRAEVIPWDKLVNAGSWKKAQQNGLIILEKKDYIVKDGDVIQIRFHL